MLSILRDLLASAALTALRLDSAHRQMQHLRRLDPHLLQDIGLGDGQLPRPRAEWDAPEHWRRPSGRGSFVQDRHDTA